MEPIVCTNCGSKFAASRDRCPKCRMRAAPADPAIAAAPSRWVAWAAGFVLTATVLAVGLLWVTTHEEPDTAVTTAADPLTDRRPKPDADGEGREAVDRERQGRFMDPAHRGTVSYGAGDYATALAQFQEAVARNPRDAESMSNLGQVLVKLGRTEEAVSHFERACELNPDRWAYRFNLARALALLTRWDESIESYRHAQRLFPGDYVTTFNLGLTLHKKGDDRAAVDEYRKAVELSPEEPSFRMALGISYEALGQHQEAAEAYAEYLRLAPSAPDAEKVRARIALLTGQPAPAGSSGPSGPSPIRRET